MYEFPQVSEYRHSFYHTPQKPSRIKKWSIFLHFHCIGVIGDTGKNNRDLIPGTDGQRYRETIFWRRQQQQQKCTISLGLSRVFLYNRALSWIRVVPCLCLARRELQPSPLSLTCPMAPVPINPLQQQQGVNVCVCIQRKGLPWPLLRFLHFLFPTHTSTGVTTLPWTSPPGTSLSARSTTRTAQENTFKVGTFLKWAHFIFGLF